MKTKTKNNTNYVDALETEHLYAVLTKLGRIQLLLRPTIKQLRKRGQRGWRLFGTVDNGLSDADSILSVTIQAAIQEIECTGASAKNNGKKHKTGEGCMSADSWPSPLPTAQVGYLFRNQNMVQA